MHKPIIQIKRYWQDENQTSGVCTIIDGDNFPLFSALSLERGWRNNENNVSCVPLGVYTVKYEYSPRFKTMLWELKGVSGRSECKFHASNYWHQLNGCISLGLKYQNMNDDDYRDITNSRNTMAVFDSVLRGYNELTLNIFADTNFNNKSQWI